MVRKGIVATHSHYFGALTAIWRVFGLRLAICWASLQYCR
jgi:hypothetical protein